MHPRAEEFVERARAVGLDPDVRTFPEGTHSAADAAEAIGCPVGAVAASIVFVVDGRAVVVVASGANRVAESRLAAQFDADPGAVTTAGPATVRSATGWSIGGVPPFCHEESLPTLVDRDLLAFETVWAAAGTPEAVFPTDPDRLCELADAETVDVVERD